MEKNLSKEKKIITIGLLVVIILVVAFYFNNSQNIDEEYSEDYNIENEEAGLYDIVKIDDLSFQLTEIELYKRNDEGFINTMWWKYSITNEGKSIKRVSDCGILLFEDGSQYKFQVDLDSSEIITDCNYYEMVPGAEIGVWYGFRFSDEYNAKLWKEVPGSEIIFFSQQSGGLVKYIIDKSEISYTN